MPNSNAFVSENCWRFVDGELTTTEENDFLARCEAEPAGYRQLALALVEQRRLAAMLSQLRDDQQTQIPLPITKSSYLPTAKQPASRWATRWMFSLAASLLIGLFLGYAIPFSGDSQSGLKPDFKPDSGSLVSEQQPDTNSQIVGVQDHLPAYPNADPNADGSLPIRSVASGHTPLDDYWDDEETLVSLARELKPRPTLDEETVHLLRDNGLNVNRHQHVFLFEMSDGSRLAVPAEFTFLSSSPR